MNEIDGKLKYGGKQIVDSFNSIANTEGQMEWGLAYHPYPCPMTEPEFWDDPQSTGLFTNDFNSPVINFANLNVLTDYFVQDTLRRPQAMCATSSLRSRASHPTALPGETYRRFRRRPMLTPITWWTATHILTPTRSAVR